MMNSKINLKKIVFLLIAFTGLAGSATALGMTLANKENGPIKSNLAQTWGAITEFRDKNKNLKKENSVLETKNLAITKELVVAKSENQSLYDQLVIQRKRGFAKYIQARIKHDLTERQKTKEQKIAFWKLRRKELKKKIVALKNAKP